MQSKLMKIDPLIISLFEKLVEKFKERLVLVESGDFGDFNVRVVIRNRSDEDIDEVLEIARQIEKKYNYENSLLIDVIDEEDWRNLNVVYLVPPPHDALDTFIKRLRQVFKDRLVLVESGNFGDFNVRVIIRDRSDEDIDKVLEIARQIEKEYQMAARFVVDVIPKEEL